MKRTPLPRPTKPLARSTKPIPKRRKTQRRVSVLRDQGYMDWLKTQLCVVCRYSYPGGEPMTCQVTASEPAHTVNNGGSSKGPDSSCIPLCHRCHAEMDGRLSTKITTKTAFAEKYSINLAVEAAEHFACYQAETGRP